MVTRERGAYGIGEGYVTRGGCGGCVGGSVFVVGGVRTRSRSHRARGGSRTKESGMGVSLRGFQCCEPVSPSTHAPWHVPSQAPFFAPPSVPWLFLPSCVAPLQTLHLSSRAQVTPLAAPSVSLRAVRRTPVAPRAAAETAVPPVRSRPLGLYATAPSLGCLLLLPPWAVCSCPLIGLQCNCPLLGLYATAPCRDSSCS